MESSMQDNPYMGDADFTSLMKSAERVIGQISRHLKNILFLCGFITVISLGNLSDENLVDCQEHMRQLSRDLAPAIPEIFGLYHRSPEKFLFSPGDKVTIRKIAEYFKGLLQVKSSSQNTDNTNLKDKEENKHLKSLRSAVTSWIEAHINWDAKTNMLQFLEVQVENIKDVWAGVYKCSLCSQNIKLSLNRPNSVTSKWVLRSLTKHFKSLHLEKLNKDDPRERRRKGREGKDDERAILRSKGRKTKTDALVNVGQKTLGDCWDNLVVRFAELAQKEPEVADLITKTGISTTTNAENITSNCSFFVKKLIQLAVKNRGHKNRNRYDEIMKDIASYLWINSGPLVYEILEKNLGLPSASTVHNHLDGKSPLTIEGVVMIHELKQYLLKHQYPLKVWISEDGTRIISKVEYNSKENQLIGLVPPLVKGMPKVRSYPFDNPQKVKEWIDKISKSQYMYIVLAQPMVKNSAPFLLMMFSTNNQFSSEDVLLRWKNITNELKKEGIDTCGFSSDGDPRLLKAMKSKTDLFKKSKTSKNWSEWFRANRYRTPCIQDNLHIVNKLKNKLMKTKPNYPPSDIRIGSYIASREHLLEICTQVSKDQHGLTSGDLDPTKKMNYKGAIKIAKATVQNCLLENVHQSQGTVAYIDIMQQMLSICEDDLTGTEILRKIWYVCFFLRGWRNWLLKKKIPLKHFITTNCYECVELNAHNIITSLTICREQYDGNCFIPSLQNSQGCENYFRAARALSTVKSTIVNFSVQDFLHKANRINQEEILAHQIKDVFCLPRMKKPVQGPDSDILPSDDVIHKIVCVSRQQARTKLEELGIANPCFSMDRLTPTTITRKDGEQSADCDDEQDENIEVTEDSSDSSPDEETFHEIENIFETVGKKFSVKDFTSIAGQSNSKLCFKISHGGKQMLVKKSTYLWLCQDGFEKVSKDISRRFHVNKPNK